MKVLHILKTSSGAEWAFNQISVLKKHGIDVTVVLPDSDGKMYNKYIKENIQVVIANLSLPIKNPFTYFKRKSIFLDIVKQEQPDIIHMHFVTNVIMGRLSLRKTSIPRIFQVPGPLHLEHGIFRFIDLSLSNEYDYWIAACNKTKELYLKTKIERDKIFLNYYGGYGGDMVNQYKTSSNILHNDFNLPLDSKLVGMISYFYKPKYYLFKFRGIKGHEDFIDAITLARYHNPKIIGIIIGGPWGNSLNYMKRVKKYASKKCPDGIIFTGHRTDLKKIYQELDIAVHPSHSENLGGAAESLAAGIPTISTNVGGFTDIVKNGFTGITVFPKRPDMLSQSILEVLNDYDKHSQYALNGQTLVKEMLDINNTVPHLIKIYRKVLKEI